MTDNDSLAAALAAVQSKLPEIGKSKTATVQTRAGGSYSYSYADLAEISRSVLPLLGAAGLAWMTKPTLTEDGKLVLAYALVHGRSGEREEGTYPLPQNGSPQELGSAITYGRRYCLCAVVGVAAEQDDDDGRAATERGRSLPHRPPAPDQTDREPVDTVVDAVQTGAMLTLSIRAAATLDDLEPIRDAITASLAAGRISDDKAAELVAALDKKTAKITTKSRNTVAETPTTEGQDAGQRVTPPQLNAIHVLYGECGWSDRTDKLRATAALIGRKVESSTELTKQEASRLIEALHRVAEGDDPAAALTELVDSASRKASGDE